MMKIDQIISALRRRLIQNRHNRRIESISARIAQTDIKEQEAPFLFFNASTRLSGLSLNAGFSLITSWAVRNAGFPVIHWVCDSGMSRCVLGTSSLDPAKKPPCVLCKAQSSVCYQRTNVRRFRYQADSLLEKRIKDLPLTALETLSYEQMPLGPLVLPSVRWILRCHHLQDDEPTRYLYRQYLLSAWNIAQKYQVFLSHNKPRAVVVFNGMFYPEAVVRYISLQEGIRVISHEVGLLPCSGFFTEGEATAYPLDLPADFELSDDQNARLDEYLARRFKGNFSMAGVQFWPEIKPLDSEYVARIKQFKQVVPVFTNVVFDTSQGHANTLFKNMFEWLDDVLLTIQQNPDTLFVIRAHPDELRPGKESRETVQHWVKDHGVKDLPNVIFFNANDFVSSYEWIQYAKFVMVYNSTIGLEASILGKAVLCAGRARFTQVESVFFPKNKEEYNDLLELFLRSSGAIPPMQHRMNARKFLYYQLFCSSLSFESFLEEDTSRRGYVQVRNLYARDLTPEKSDTIRVLLDGLLLNKSFLLEP